MKTHNMLIKTIKTHHESTLCIDKNKKSIVHKVTQAKPDALDLLFIGSCVINYAFLIPRFNLEHFLEAPTISDDAKPVVFALSNDLPLRPIHIVLYKRDVDNQITLLIPSHKWFLSARPPAKDDNFGYMQSGKTTSNSWERFSLAEASIDMPNSFSSAFELISNNFMQRVSCEALLDLIRTTDTAISRILLNTLTIFTNAYELYKFGKIIRETSWIHTRLKAILPNDPWIEHALLSLLRWDRLLPTPVETSYYSIGPELDFLLDAYNKTYTQSAGQSATTARGGGLNMPPRRGLYHRVVLGIRLFHRQNVLFQLLLMCLLISDILADCSLIKANRAYTVSACPKVIASQIFAFPKVSTVYQNG